MNNRFVKAIIMVLFTSISLLGWSSNRDKVDFDYPQQVCADALKDIKTSLKNGDGEGCVDAIIRYSIAQGHVSAENMGPIVNQIEDVINKEKRAPYRAVLSYFEARVFKSYKESFGTRGRNNPEEEVPADYTEWDNSQFDARIESLIAQTLQEKEALSKEPITNYKGIIEQEPDAADYIPHLFAFLSQQCLELVDNENPLANKIYSDWEQSVTDNIPALIYVKNEQTDFSWGRLRLYNEYADNEHSGMILAGLSGNDYYDMFKGYVARYPDGRYTNEIKNLITGIEQRKANTSSNSKITSRDPIEVQISSRNLDSFMVHLYRVPDKLALNTKISEYKIAELELVDEKEVKVNGAIPFSSNDTVFFSPQPVGDYVVLTSYKSPEGKTIKLVAVSSSKAINVRDFQIFRMDDKNGYSTIFAVDDKTGAPLSGIKITTDKNANLGVTNANGILTVKTSEAERNLIGQMGDNPFKATVSYSMSNFNRYGDNATHATIFTDLAVYRPGETVNMSAICFSNSIDKRNVIAGQKIQVKFSDSNGKELATDTLVTDEYGRIATSFSVPEGRLNGTFSITLYTGKSYLASKRVTVSEYKLPTFAVDMSENKRNFNVGEPVAISGKVETFSGMPVAGAEVKLSLARKYWSWRWFYDDSKGDLMNDTIVTTDADGKFSIYYPTSTFGSDNDRWNYGSFEVKAICTNSAGETQESETRFILGQRRGLEITGSDLNFINDKPITIPVVFNTTNDSETSVLCAYKLAILNSDEKIESNMIASGTFMSDKPVIDLTKVASGEYTLHVEIDGDKSADKDKAKIVLYRPDDKKAPIENTVMWIPSSGRKVDDKNVAHITIATSTPESHIYYIARSRTEIVSQGWLHYKPGIHTLKLQIPNKPDEFLNVEFNSVYSSICNNEAVTMLSEKNIQKVELKVTSFRDRLTPGDKETWTFQLADKDGNPRNGAVLIALTNKAVEKIEENKWGFNYVPYNSFRPYYLYGTHTWNSYVWTSNEWRAKQQNTYRFTEPELYMYDQYSIFGMALEYGTDYRMVLGAGATARPRMYMSKNASMADDAMPVALEEASSDFGAADMESGEIADRAALDNVQVREGDVKTAVWQPLLTTDEKGNLKVEFEVPATNSTWIMKAIGYTSELLISNISKETMTQKPIMVKPSVPRFVRQGDKCSLAGVIQNATETDKECDAVIELFNPRTGEIVSTRTFHDTVGPRGTKPVNIEWEVTDSLPFIGFRVKAATGNFGDGEQVMIPVLSSISPVIETQPFYIDAATPKFSFRLPQFTDDARVTLEYCDNPVWYCVTALPTIFDKNYGITTLLAHNLFAISVARGVAKSQPNIKEATDYWLANQQDSTLVSMLSRNSDLKIGTLLASPWINDAERQTLRMSKIGELFDEEQMTVETDHIIRSLQQLQMSDGGWTWFFYPGCTSSVYTTGTVLELLGEVKHLGFLTDDSRLTDMIEKGVKYYDEKMLELYQKQLKQDKKNHSGFADYVYIRSMHQEVKLPKDNAEMMMNCLKAMSKDWKGTSMGNKAYYALALNRNGYEKVAKSIMQSIREYAITKPATGTYWDSLDWGWHNKVSITATILNAMAEVDPRTEEIDNVRKWMLLNKQSNDWGGSSLAAHAVYALLTSGSKWLERNGKPHISIAGNTLKVDKADEYLGYFRHEIEATSGAEVKIERSGASPAWGAVYSQFHAPMTQIKEVSIDELSISKEYYVYATDGSLHAATEFKVGDKVQVRTVIKTNKDLEYVTVTDERASCFEPVDQISGYRYADRAYYYLETKDSTTNLFFSYLGKGTKIISYDVYVTAPGEYNAGIATAQCQYSPQIAAHSAGKTVVVK